VRGKLAAGPRDMLQVPGSCNAQGSKERRAPKSAEIQGAQCARKNIYKPNRHARSFLCSSVAINLSIHKDLKCIKKTSL
jgi:hypothetical protein